MKLIAMELQQVPPAPGQVTGTQQPAPASGQPAGAPPPAGPGGMGNMGMMLLMFLPMLLVLFLLNRSQGKKQKELENKLKKGDRVATSAGIIGKIVELGTKYAKLEIAPGVKVQILKSTIQGVDTGEEPATPAQGKDKDKDEASSKDASTDKK